MTQTLTAGSDMPFPDDPWRELVRGGAAQDATMAAYFMAGILRTPEGRISGSAADRLGEELAERGPCDLAVVEARLRRALGSRFDEATWDALSENWDASAPSDPAQIQPFVEAVAAAVFGRLWNHARPLLSDDGSGVERFGPSRFRMRRNGPVVQFAPSNVHSQREGAELRPNALANARNWSQEEWAQHIRHTLEVLRFAPREVRDVLVPLVQRFLDRATVENRAHYVGVGAVADGMYPRADRTWVVRTGPPPPRAPHLQVADALAPALAVAESQPPAVPEPEPQPAVPEPAVRIVIASSQWGGDDRPITASEHEPAEAAEAAEAAPDESAGNWDEEDVSAEAMAERLARPAWC